MSQSLLDYKIENIPDEGFIARCLIEPTISVFSKEDDEKLSKGIKSAAKLYATMHPTPENKSIRENDFEMRRID